MKQFFITLLFFCFLFTTKAQQHFIKTDALGYLYTSRNSQPNGYLPKISLGYEYCSDTLNQSFGIQLNYGSFPLTIIDSYNNFDTAMTLNSTYGFSLQPEFRYYLANKQRKVSLFGNVGCMMYAGKVNKRTVLIKNDYLLNEVTSGAFGVGINVGGGMKYCFSKIGVF